jgi:hypothetical protein
MSAIRTCATILFGVSFVFAAPIYAQPSNPCDPRYHWLTPSNCQGLITRIGQEIAELRGDITQQSARIAAARRRFWATYPDKSGAAAARDEFGKMLYDKDAYYVWIAVTNALGGARGAHFIGGKMDGGISQSASPEFDDWTKAIVANMGGDPFRNLNPNLTNDDLRDLQHLPERFVKALAASEKKHEIYVVQRDWAEFDAAGREPAGLDDPAVFFPAMCVRLQEIPWDDALSEYGGMLKVLGDDAIRKAVQQVRAAPKGSGGFLRVSVQEPIKLTPSGNEVPDPSVPQPEGVIGFVSSPIQAVERLAIQGDDRRYLLWLLTRNRPSRSSTIDLATMWQYADTTYRQFVIAFGEQDVLQAARLVRTATKRMTSGGVMDPAAIGATRSDPYRAFEDIVTRKNPRGYVRAILAVKRNLKTAADVDAAYKSFVAASGETAVLAAAKKMAAKEPNANYDGDLDMLTSVLNGSLSLDKPAETLVDFPDYLAWKGFPAGTKVTYVHRKMGRISATNNSLVAGKPMFRSIYLLNSIDDSSARLWLTEIAYDPDGKAHSPRDTEIGYTAKIPQPTGRSPAKTLLESGQKTLMVNGRQILTRWQYVSAPYGACTMLTTSWTSDEVPTGLVRKLEEMRCQQSASIDETILESVQGVRAGGAPNATAGGNVPESDPSSVSAAPPAVPPAGNNPASAAATQPGRPSTDPGLNQSPQAPPIRAVTPSTPGGASAASSRTNELQQRYKTDLAHFNNDMNELGQFSARTRTRLPPDVVEARAQLQRLLGAYVVAIRRSNYDEAEQDLQTAEATALLIEKFLGR